MGAKKILKCVVLAVVVGNLALIAVVFLGGKSPRPEPLPNPNGYDYFVRAGQMFTGRAVDYYLTNSLEQLAGFVSKNKEALQLVRLGLSRECRVPNDYSPEYTERHVRELPASKQLAYGLCAEGKLAEMENRTNDAVQSYLDAIRFGVMSSQAGVIFSKLVGIACEAEPRQRLQFLLPSLNAQQCMEVAQALETINFTECPVERNIWEEKKWVKSFGVRAQLEAILEYKSLRTVRNNFTKKVQTNRLQRIQQMIAFTERAYELEKGRKPQNLSELVPDYLKSIPIDPLTRTNIVYSP